MPEDHGEMRDMLVPRPPRHGAGRLPAGLLLLMALLFFAALLSPVDYSGSDAQGTLLTAQALLETGTLRLDRYMERTYVPARKALGEVSGTYRLIRGHCYHAFPVGSSLVSLPFVWLANLRGENMLDPKDDAQLQNLLSALIVALSGFAVFLVARSFAGENPSLLLAAALVGGSPLISTNGTALWSSGAASLFALVALLLIVRHVRAGARLRPWMLGACLGCAILCRPTAAVFACCVVGFLIVRDARRAGGVLIAGALTFLPLVAYSMVEFGQPLPVYYVLSQRLPRPTLVAVGLAALVVASVLACARAGGSLPLVRRIERVAKKAGAPAGGAALLAVLVLMAAHGALGRRLLPAPWAMFAAAVNGAMVSPSRGLLVFCPYLVVAGVVLVAHRRVVRKDPLFWLSAAWLGLHWAAVARPTRWYGGHCFGPRMFAEAFPAAIIIVLLAWERLAEGSGPWRRLGMIALVLGFALGLFIHTYQGLFNPWPVKWNSAPNIDNAESDLFAWRYAQFLAGPKLVARRQIDHGTRRLVPYPLGAEVAMTDTGWVYFHNLVMEEPDAGGLSRRTATAEAALWLLPGAEIRDHPVIALDLLAAADARKRVYVRVKGTDAPILRITWREPRWSTVEFPCELLVPNRLNAITLEVYPTDSPGANLQPGMRLWRMRLRGRSG